MRLEPRLPPLLHINILFIVLKCFRSHKIALSRNIVVGEWLRRGTVVIGPAEDESPREHSLAARFNHEKRSGRCYALILIIAVAFPSRYSLLSIFSSARFLPLSFAQ